MLKSVIHFIRPIIYNFKIYFLLLFPFIRVNINFIQMRKQRKETAILERFVYFISILRT